MDEHLSWIAIEALRSKPSFTEAENKVVRILQRHIAALPESFAVFAEAAEATPEKSEQEMRGLIENLERREN